MDDPAVVARGAHRVRLRCRRTACAHAGRRGEGRLLKNTEDSVARGTFGSPTFFVGREIFFGKDRLRDVEEEIVRAG